MRAPACDAQSRLSRRLFPSSLSFFHSLCVCESLCRSSCDDDDDDDDDGDDFRPSRLVIRCRSLALPISPALTLLLLLLSLCRRPFLTHAHCLSLSLCLPLAVERRSGHRCSMLSLSLCVCVCLQCSDSQVGAQGGQDRGREERPVLLLSSPCFSFEAEWQGGRERCTGCWIARYVSRCGSRTVYV